MQWQFQGWAILSGLEQGFQFVSEATGTLSDIWLRGPDNSVGGYDYTRGNTVIDIHGKFGDVLDTFTVSTSEPGTSHYKLVSNLILNQGVAYWIMLRAENSDSKFAWTLFDVPPPPPDLNLEHAYRYEQYYDGQWQFQTSPPGGFAIGVLQAVSSPETLPLLDLGKVSIDVSEDLTLDPLAFS